MLARYVADIEARLRAVSRHLPPEEFEKLVRDIALMKIRFDEIDAKPGAQKPLSDLRTDR